MRPGSHIEPHATAPSTTATVAALLALVSVGCGAGETDPSETFRNLEIRVQALEGREVQLREGRVTIPGEGLQVVLDPLHLTGRLDRPDRPVTSGILSILAGGSQIATELLVAVQEDGQMRYFGSSPLGGPMRLEGIRFQDGRIILDLLRHGPGDSPCCPTVPVHRRFRLMSDEVMEEPSLDPPAEEGEPDGAPDAAEPLPD